MSPCWAACCLKNEGHGENLNTDLLSLSTLGGVLTLDPSEVLPSLTSFFATDGEGNPTASRDKFGPLEEEEIISHMTALLLSRPTQVEEQSPALNGRDIKLSLTHN
ncbi:hypothetical protein E2320_006171 [Naja naja]|nr:hypothetical protein E2320_006171 [Naja naja]